MDRPVARIGVATADGAGADAHGAAAKPSDSWAIAFGARWHWYFAAVGVLLFVAGALAPLADIDLPMHLATGEWIARTRGVPFVEPFAWTRAGAPYFSYSWAAELTYYELLLRFGPFALHALHGATMAAAGGAVLWLGRTARWGAWPTALVAALNVLLAFTIVAALRPQAVLFVTVPLAWACVERLLADEARGRLRWPPLAGLLAAAAITANTHLLFALTAVPLGLLLVRPARHAATVAAAAAAVLAGWACSPYALAYPAMFRLYFQPDALFTSPSPITEFAPGFALFSPRSPFAAVVLLLTTLPWALGRATMGGRERALFAALWLAGLVGFAMHARAIAIWWLAVLPLAARVLHLLPESSSPTLLRGQRAALATIVALLALRAALQAPPLWKREGDAVLRQLPSYAAPMVEPLAEWLDAHARPGVGGRVLTSFNFGSYLAWRLPGYSASIDGRTIFPDSAAKPEAFRVATDGPLPLGPWRSAELALVPLHYPVASVLDTAAGWRRVATADSSATVPQAMGLWVTEAWWRRAGRGPLPASAGAPP